MKHKEISKEEYLKLFCQEKRIRKRMVIYVSKETHDMLIRVADLFKKEHVTTSSLADAILTHHLSLYASLLNRLHKEQTEDFLTFFCKDKSDDSDSNADMHEDL